MTVDPAVSALVGAAIGGIVGVVGTVLTVWSASRRERQNFLRTASQQHADRVRTTYEHALNVFFNLNRGGSPDRATYGDLFARVALFGSPAVNDLMDAFLAAPVKDRQIDVDALVIAMKKHLSELEGVAA